MHKGFEDADGYGNLSKVWLPPQHLKAVPLGDGEDPVDLLMCPPQLPLARSGNVGQSSCLCASSATMPCVSNAD